MTILTGFPVTCRYGQNVRNRIQGEVPPDTGSSSAYGRADPGYKVGKVVAEVIPPRIGQVQFAKAEFGKCEFEIIGDVMETIALKNERESQ